METKKTYLFIALCVLGILVIAGSNLALSYIEESKTQLLQEAKDEALKQAKIEAMLLQLEASKNAWLQADSCIVLSASEWEAQKENAKYQADFARKELEKIGYKLGEQ